MTIVLTETTTTHINPVRADGLWMSHDEALRATGWAMKPEGFCKDDVCVPTPTGREAEFTSDGQVNVAAFWNLMSKPAVHTEAKDVWFLGEAASDRNRALLSLEVPDFTLPDLDGKLHSLSDFRNKRILVATWASW